MMTETQEEKSRSRFSARTIVALFILVAIPAMLGKSFYPTTTENRSEVAEKVQTTIEESSGINHADSNLEGAKTIPSGRLERARYYAKQSVTDKETEVRLNDGTSVDLFSELKRIGDGKRDRHRNDGTEFFNRERRLPQRENGYYTEFVHRTGNEGPGPCRIVIGSQGDIWYTPDHYQTFPPVNTTAKQLKKH